MLIHPGKIYKEQAIEDANVMVDCKKKANLLQRDNPDGICHTKEDIILVDLQQLIYLF